MTEMLAGWGDGEESKQLSWWQRAEVESSLYTTACYEQPYLASSVSQYVIDHIQRRSRDEPQDEPQLAAEVARLVALVSACSHGLRKEDLRLWEVGDVHI